MKKRLEEDLCRRSRISTYLNRICGTKTGVYAGGDAVTGAATVILAMGAGRAAAAKILEHLQK